LLTEIKRTQAELKVLDAVEHIDTVDVTRLEPTQPVMEPVHISGASYLADDVVPADLNMASLLKTLADSVNQNRLPPPEPSVFYGDALKYPAWKASFATLIESRNIAPLERIHYLKKYVSGEAKECIEGNFYFDSEDAYESAKSILDKRYGDRFLVAEAFRDKLDAWPKVSTSDSKGLRKLADFLHQCLMAMKHVPTLQIFNDCRENRKMLPKLPDWLTRRWSRIVAENTVDYPPFETFVKFVAKEADIACNPITSCQTPSKFQDNTRTSTRFPKRNAAANTLANDVSKTKMNTKSMYTNLSKCLFCEMANHILKNCRKFRSDTPSGRRQFLMKKKDFVLVA
jgi:hypothetical protein